MRYIYFADNLDSKDYVLIWNWAFKNYGLYFPTEHANPKWKWIKGDNYNISGKVLGIVLPDEEAEILFRLRFPYKIKDSFSTLETFEK